MEARCYAAMSAGGKLEATRFPLGKCGPFDVQIAITHCGICSSDTGLVDGKWGISSFPVVPGHEIVGVVQRTGRYVRHVEAGQRVGVGWQRDSCGSCEQCMNGNEHVCSHLMPTCGRERGGFSDYIRVNGRFVFPIPDNLSSGHAAPLLCAGITAYSALSEFGVKPGMKVGVIGIGGMGHLALQFARAFGCEVTAFSSSHDKGDEARKFGAHHFVHPGDSEPLSLYMGTQDFILSTVSGEIDVPGYLAVLKPKGMLCIAGFPGKPVSFPAGLLIAGQKAISGKPIGSPDVIRKMLQFAAVHDIRPKIQSLPMSRRDEAMDMVRQGKARYRIVLEN